jgi:hypothetical protein
MAIEIPDSSEFYIRSALTAGLRAWKELLELSQQALDSDEASEVTKNMARGNISHIGQLYREAVAEFRDFPLSIQPDSEFLDYDPWKPRTEKG